MLPVEGGTFVLPALGAGIHALSLRCRHSTGMDRRAKPGHDGRASDPILVSGKQFLVFARRSAARLRWTLLRIRFTRLRHSMGGECAGTAGASAASPKKCLSSIPGFRDETGVGGHDETDASRFFKGARRKSRRPGFHRTRRRPGSDAQDRHVRAGDGARRRAGPLRPGRREDRARCREQGGRRAGQAGRADHRGRPDDQSGHRARLLQARRARGYRGFPRLDPLDAGARHGARRPQARQARDDRRHRSRPHPYGQSMAVSLPAERLILGPRARRLRRQHARQEEMGHRALDRRFRHRRRQGPHRGARQASARPSRSTRATPTRARISRRSCSP